MSHFIILVLIDAVDTVEDITGIDMQPIQDTVLNATLDAVMNATDTVWSAVDRGVSTMSAFIAVEIVVGGW